MSVEVCTLSFFFYSFIGWLYESIICSLIKERRLINRGFLLGPYCPVYGCGAVLCYLLLGSIENPFMLFLAAAVLCSALEYVTGYGMEKLFQAKWWDYSHLPLNLHGRICLYGAILFGMGNVLICKKIQPGFIGLLQKFNSNILTVAVIILVGIFIFDIITSLRNWIDFNKHLKHLQELFVEKMTQAHEDISDLYQSKIQPKIVANKRGIEVWVFDKKTQFEKRELRFLYAFPKLNIKSRDMLVRKVELRGHIRKVFGKWF